VQQSERVRRIGVLMAYAPRMTLKHHDAEIDRIGR
jgi:hypothetical protein